MNFTSTKINNGFNEGHVTTENIEKLMTELPKIDYSTHPAYGGIEKNITLYERVRAMHMFIRSLIRVVREYRQVSSAINNSLSKDDDARKKNNDICASFCKDGVMGYKAPAEKKNTLRVMVEEHFNVDIDKVDLQGERQLRFAVYRKERPDIFKCLDELLDDVGALADGKAYLGKPEARCNVLKLFIQDAHEQFRRGLFSDINVADSPLNYLHIDSATHPQVKLLLYQTPVDSDHGPFLYVRGSHRIPRTIADRLIRIAVDRSVVLQEWNRESRRLFSALPKIIQRKCEMGNDILKENPAIKIVSKFEKEFLSDVDGDVLMFDNLGLHRGGLINHGRRAVLHTYLDL